MGAQLSTLGAPGEGGAPGKLQVRRGRAPRRVRRDAAAAARALARSPAPAARRGPAAAAHAPRAARGPHVIAPRPLAQVLRRRHPAGPNKRAPGAAGAAAPATPALDAAATDAAATAIAAAELAGARPLGVCAAPGAPYAPQVSGPPLPPCEAERLAFIKTLEILVRDGGAPPR
jgi:hypothetical protein